MLILLSDNVCGSRLSSAHVMALNVLATTHRHGHHIVSGSLSVLSFLSRLDALTEESRGTYRQARARHHELGTLRRVVTHHVEVYIDSDDAKIERCPTTAGRICYRVPLGRCAALSWLSPTHLLAEDQDDADIYRSVAQFYLRWKGRELKGLRLSFAPYGGGGSCTPQALTAHATSAFTICIVDSDKKFPGAALGDTARTTQAVGRGLAEQCVTHVEVLDCHELENLIPVGAVEHVLERGDSREFQAGVRLCGEKGVFGAVGEFRFLDIKAGLRGYDVLHSEGRLRQFWERASNQICKEAIRCKQECSQRERAHCTCVVFFGFESLVPRVATSLKEASDWTMCNVFRVGDSAGLSVLGGMLLSWGCAYPQVYC